MKRCIDCGIVSTDEDCRVYENVPVIREDGSHAGYTEREHTCDCCPKCGAIVLDDYTFGVNAEEGISYEKSFNTL